MTSPAPIIILAGPTGSGKSAVAVALAQILGRSAIVNADAFQLYRGIEILSAAPDTAALAAVPHHLYGVLSLSQTCDAVRYAALARKTLAELASRDITPIVVGGSGLYLKALTHGLADTPPGDADLRAALDSLELPQLVAWLEAIDPAGADVTNLKNRRYVTRNLEIALLSGRPASAWKNRFPDPDPRVRAFVLTRERADLYDRIERRTACLFRAGALVEVGALDFASLSDTSVKAIGLREIREHLDARLSEDDCLATIAQATRRYAKRQGTWFRRETVYQPIALAPTESAESAASRIARALPSR